jgi:PAS domain S-box-containing protein
MNLEFNFVVAALWGTAVITLGLSLYAWRRRALGGWAVSFAVLGLGLFIWSFFYGLEVAATTLQAKVWLAKVEYLGFVSVPVSWFVFSMQYTGRSAWLTRRRLVALCLIPCLSLILVFTNEAHGLNWAAVSLDESGPIPLLETTYGSWFWIHSAYSYALIIAGTILILQAYVRYPKAYRRQNATLVIGSSLPLLVNALTLSGVLPIPKLDYTPFAFTVSILLIANAIFRYQLFDMVPVARRTAVDNMRDGMMVLDMQNRVIDINPAATALFRQNATEMIGRSLGEFLQNQPHIIDSFRDVSEVRTEVTVHAGERDRFYELHISPLLDGQERMNGRLIVLYDITARKEAEQELARARDEALEASRFKSELLARVSHELRTPLNVILGYSEMLQEGIYGPLAEAQWLPTQKIIESTGFLARQVNELLDLAKLEVGQLSLHPEPFAIADLVQGVHERMQVLAKAKRIALVSQVQADVPPILVGDPLRIEQILLNLVGNGIKFGREGTVTQSVFLSDEQQIILQVSDQGIGIPPEMREAIFEPFKQVDGSLTRLQHGTGLGLAIVKQLAELMGGSITVQSEVGQGSTFTVCLPLPSAEKEILWTEQTQTA